MTRRSRLAGIAGAGLLALLPTLAAAHTGVGDASGLAHGFTHPIGGLDHVLTMVAVGLFAVTLGGRALWAVPATFVGLMVVGGLLGMAGLALPQVEVGIALSVVVLGLVVALGWQCPLAGAMALVGVFAVFHGFAHGAEMPAGTSASTYALGFVGATALLHLIGIGLGKAGTAGSRRIVQTGGAAMALAGVGLLTGTL